jgi:hypothetical protein
MPPSAAGNEFPTHAMTPGRGQSQEMPYFDVRDV